MTQIPDAPWIRNAADMSCPVPDKVPVCPVCLSSEPERIYVSREGDALGCENCVDSMDAWDWMERQPEDSRGN